MERIGPYRIVRKLGEGGMGVVYAAEDERLNRTVAIKIIRDAGDGSARERFLREARAAASLTHPNVCQLFDIGDEEGSPFLVMELLDGESLAERLRRGPLPLQEAAQTALSMLTALDALHARGFVHRDLKPSNIFLTSLGVKLLDFGLVRDTRAVALSPDEPTLAGGGANVPLTLSGMIVGTPRYMAPEQLLNAPVDGRTDLFAIGGVLYEMISGRPAFEDENAMRLFHAVVYENPPNLAGSAAITAINRIIHRAMAKRIDDRYANAAAMAKDLRDVMLISDVAAPVVARRITRLIALPLRVLRSDPETDFLAFALPEAITTTLAGVGSLIVRSSAHASRLAELDPKQLAEEADVDVALTGTLLRAGDQIRVNSQLVELPSGAVIWSQASQMTMSDVFELQDRLTQRIVESLELPLSDRESRLVRRDVPASPRAHEFYLRATQQSENPTGWTIARDLFLRAVDEDPRYAPAWARLSRMHLLLGKYAGDTEKQYELAESAARHALELNPELPIAHHAFAHIAVSKGKSLEAMTRLLDRVARGSNDPAVFAGLVTVFRFCGLLEASAAAHEQARQLDPNVSTSAAHTYWMLGRYDEALAAVDPERDMGDASMILESMGRLDEAIAVYGDRRARLEGSNPALMSFFNAFTAALQRRNEVAVSLFSQHHDFPDPEGLFYMARALVRCNDHEAGLDRLDRAERGGFFCYPFFASDAWLDPLRADPRFVEILRRAAARTREAQRAFEEHAGSRVLAVG
ncbi:MAG TPA: FlgO family outer membrane protein [Thermoanaerobaculia bacterium]|nr:FlgO family outer membrane protein [Thermoanaerobaculia bacterium]